MRYPMLKNWIVFRRAGGGRVRAADCLTGEEYLMHDAVYRFARALDGRTDPFSVCPSASRKSVLEMLGALDRQGLLRWDRILERSDGTVYRTVWVWRPAPRQRALCRLANGLLMLLWLPVLCLGFTQIPAISLELTIGSWLGYLAGILPGLALHELAHAAAATAFAGRVFEIGVMVEWFCPGAYTLYDCGEIKGRGRRIQACAAGVEMNFLLAGAALLMAGMQGGGFWLGAALCNMMVGAVNLVLLEGRDGMEIVWELLDIPNGGRDVPAVLGSRRARRALNRDGWGALRLAVYKILSLFRLLPVLMGVGCLCGIFLILAM